MDQDPSQIPPGNFCYRVYPLRDGEVLSTDIANFGSTLREYSYCIGFKEVLCPYWQRTNYGTIKCLYNNYEILDSDRDGSIEKLSEKIGSEAAKDFPTDWALSDEIKICGINEDVDDPWNYDS